MNEIYFVLLLGTQDIYCPFMSASFGIYNIVPSVLPVSGSNLASHMVGSLKKGAKQSMSLPSTAYNTLPSHHHLRTSSSSPRVVGNQPAANSGGSHKRSPSSDSGHGTLHNPLVPGQQPQQQHHHQHLSSNHSSSRSNTPVSYHGGNKVHHTVYLHGERFFN